MTGLPYVPVWLWVLVDVLAAYRLWRLAAHDTFPPVARVRDAVLNRYDGRWPAELLMCPWCLGQWIAFGVVAASWLLPGWWLPLAAALALSAAVGLLAERA